MKRTFLILAVIGLFLNMALITKANPTDGLVLHLSFDADTIDGNIVKDLSDEGNDGIINGGAQTVPGKYGEAMSFDGIDDFVEVPLTESITFSTGDSFTVQAWFKTDVLPPANDVIVGNYRNYARDHWVLAIFGDLGEDWGKPYFAFRDASQHTVTASTQVLTDGEWHFLAGVRDQSEEKARFYVDGVLIAEVDDDTMDINSGQSVWIGEHLNRYFEGLIDEVKIWNRALTAEELKQSQLQSTQTETVVTVMPQDLQSDEFDGMELGSIWHVQNADQGSHTLMDGKLVVEGAFLQNLWAVDTTTRFYQVTNQQQFSVETSMNIEQRDVSTIAGIAIKSPTTKDSKGRDGEVVMLKLWGHGSANEEGLIGAIYNNEPFEFNGWPNHAILQFQHRERRAAQDYPGYNPPTGNIRIAMRLVRDGDNYSAWFKPEAKGDWVHVGDTTIALEGPVEVGVFVGICQDVAPGHLTVSFDNFLINQPRYLREDVNKDGVVNVLDLVLVGRSIGATGEIAADVNGDSTVNVLDLVLVGNAIGKTASAPTLMKQMEGLLTRTMVESWLREARQLNLSDPAVQRGIMVLEDLLKVLTPNATALLPNYPNPFNPETWIPYQLARDADVRISIYSTTGTLVRKLDIGQKPVGIYRDRSTAAYWDGKNELGEKVASGIYFYTFTAGDFSATRKMLIRK